MWRVFWSLRKIRDVEQLVSEVFGAFDLDVYKSNLFKMIMENNAKNIWAPLDDNWFCYFFLTMSWNVSNWKMDKVH